MGDTDQELFQDAIAPEPAAKPAEPAEPAEPAAKPAEPAGGGPGRDPATGQFVPKGGEKPAAETPAAGKPAGGQAAAEKPAAETPSGDHRVPLGEHLSVRERAQAAERERDEARRGYEMLARRLEQLERPREQPKPPDPWVDPQAFNEFVTRQQVEPLQRQQELMRDSFSRMLAEEKFGAPVVDAAFAALEAAVQTDPAMRLEASRIWQQRHPYGALITWHKNQEALKEIGSDPAAYKTRLRDELLKDPEFRKSVVEAIKAETMGSQPAANGTRPNNITRLPPSLARVTSAAPTNPGEEGPMTDAELFREATRR